MTFPTFLRVLLLSFAVLPCHAALRQVAEQEPKVFNRISTFLPCSFLDDTCNTNEETKARGIASTDDGQTIVYNDVARNEIGFVDITNPSRPKGLGTIPVDGFPAMVNVVREYAVASIDKSNGDFVNPKGELQVFDIATRQLYHAIDLGGQPKDIAVSADSKYALIAIKNAFNDDKKVNNGRPPQPPPGFLVIVDTSPNDPIDWTTQQVTVTNLDGCRFPNDPEPEAMDITKEHVAVVTFQVNNCVALVDLPSAKVKRSFTAGFETLVQVDATNDSIISQTETIKRRREPDGVSWFDSNIFAIADEGELDGGGRGFTVFNSGGSVAYTAGNKVEHLTAMLGHYPEGRSADRGNEPETIKFDIYGNTNHMFLNSERASLVLVYDASKPKNPTFVQALPGGVAPAGIVTIPNRNILLVAADADSREEGFRSVITIYQYENRAKQYPTLVSEHRPSGVPIPWGGISGLAASASSRNILYAVPDNAYKRNRILTISTQDKPFMITNEILVVDENNVLSSVPPYATFTKKDRNMLINDDNTVNLDPEGIAVSADGFWIVSEGSGGASGNVERLDFLLKVDSLGVIEEVVTLPDKIKNRQENDGFQGVAYQDPYVVVAFKSPWGSDPGSRIGVYNPNDGSWKFAFYPIDNPESQNGGSVGVSEITPLGNGKFLVTERDDQAGPDAAIKKLYTIELGDDLGKLRDGKKIQKTHYCDLMPELEKLNGLVLEKIEGVAVSGNKIWIINDNDGLDNTSGETQLMTVCGNINQK